MEISAVFALSLLKRKSFQISSARPVGVTMRQTKKRIQSNLVIISILYRPSTYGPLLYYCVLLHISPLDIGNCVR